MKTIKHILIVALLAPALSFAQLNEGFNDGNFTSAPTWTGNTGNFDISGGSLHLNDPAQATGSSYLSMPTGISLPDSAEWRADVKLDFAPSSSNYAEVYLMSDIADLTGAVNGYMVRVGDGGDDVSLYKVTAGSLTKIIDGADGTVASSPDVTIRVVRIGGVFELFLDANKSGSFTSEGTVSDNSFNTNNFAGVFCKYTSSRVDLFYFDNFFVGKTYVAPPAPPAPAKKKGELVANPQIVAPSPLSEDPLLQSMKIGYIVDTVGLNKVVANVFIFNVRGQMVTHLLKNTEIQDTPEGDVVWDGSDDNGFPLPIGVYTVLMETIDNKGGRERMKTGVAIGGKIK